MVWGSIISAGASLAGSLLGKSSADKAHDAQMELGGQSLALQREMAQNGIRWRVADAKAAGLHPLYALGAQPFNSSPVSYIPGDTSGISAGLAQAGQDIGRAVDATRTTEERQATRLDALQLERAELENDLLRSQIAKINSPAMPPMPTTRPQVIPGQSDIERHGLMIKPTKTDVQMNPQEVTASSPLNAAQEPFPISDVGFVRTPTGLAPVPSSDAKQRIEDQFIPEMMWSFRNHVIPSFGGGEPPSHRLLPPGAERWEWSSSRQEWQPVYEGNRSRSDVMRDDGSKRWIDFGGFTVDYYPDRR